MKTRVTVEVPSDIVQTTNALKYHVRRALKEYVYNHGDTLMKDFREALGDIRSVVEVQVADGNRPEDRSGMRVPDGVKFVCDVGGTFRDVVDMHRELDRKFQKIWNEDPPVTKVLDAKIDDLEARIYKVEEGDNPLLLHYTERIGDHDERLVKLETRCRDLLRVLCETPETKKVLSELLGLEADRG